MPKAQLFESQYPIIDQFVYELGWIEIGSNDMSDSFVRAYDEGGTIYEGKSSYPSIEVALKDLEKHLKANMTDRGYEFE